MMDEAMQGSLMVVAGGLVLAVLWWIAKALAAHLIAMRIERAARKKWGRQPKPKAEEGK